MQTSERRGKLLQISAEAIGICKNLFLFSFPYLCRICFSMHPEESIAKSESRPKPQSHKPNPELLKIDPSFTEAAHRPK